MPAEPTPAPAQSTDSELAVPIEPVEPTAAPPLAPLAQSQQPGSLTQVLSDWKKSIEGQWSSVCEAQTTEHERLGSAREEWEGQVPYNFGSFSPLSCQQELYSTKSLRMQKFKMNTDERSISF
jgi:hypothetical protein